MSSDPWLEKWEVVEKLPVDGGQAKVFKVRSLADPMVIGALKTLHHQDITERRERMRREVVILDTLSKKPGIARHLDSTTDAYEDMAVPLFVVTEFIAGRHPQRNTPFDIAINSTIDILRNLEGCHSAGVFHRDIKPNNIILRDGTNEPVLIDFGISFINRDDSDDLTGPNVRLGPESFFSLPDAKAGGVGTRIPIYDITLCLGVYSSQFLGIPL